MLLVTHFHREGNINGGGLVEDEFREIEYYHPGEEEIPSCVESYQMKP